MKAVARIAALLTASAALVAPTSTAADDPIPRILRNLTLSYQHNTLYPKDLDNIAFNGGGVGYHIDFGISDSRPIYIGTGIDLQVACRTKTYYDDSQYNLINIKQHTVFVNFNIPAVISLRLPFFEHWTVTPFAGLNFRLQAYGHNRFRLTGGPIDTDLDEVLDRLELGPADGNLFSKHDYGEARLRRFQLGWLVGIRLQYRRVNMHITYGSDFVKLHKNLGASNISVTVGYSI